MANKNSANEDYPSKKFSQFIGPSKQKSFFELIKDFIPFLNTEKEKAQRSLVGRIHLQLQKDAHAMLLQLQSLKETLRTELDNQKNGPLWSSFEGVINPLLREYRHIESELTHPATGEDEHYCRVRDVNNWINRAKIWVSLSSKPDDRASMIHAVIEHTLQVQDRIIDRDLKTVIDYKEHELNKLHLAPDAKKIILHRLDLDLTPLLHELHDLKIKKPPMEKCSDPKLHQLIQWKLHVDEERTKLFNRALQKIDGLISQAASPSLPEENNEHLKDLIQQIVGFENELQALQVQIENRDGVDYLQEEGLLASLSFFEEGVHQIHHDLRLTPELIERVQLLIQQFAELRNQF